MTEINRDRTPVRLSRAESFYARKRLRKQIPALQDDRGSGKMTLHLVNLSQQVHMNAAGPPILATQATMSFVIEKYIRCIFFSLVVPDCTLISFEGFQVRYPNFKNFYK